MKFRRVKPLLQLVAYKPAPGDVLFVEICDEHMHTMEMVDRIKQVFDKEFPEQQVVVLAGVRIARIEGAA
jgi:hypothetical protein